MKVEVAVPNKPTVSVDVMHCTEFSSFRIIASVDVKQHVCSLTKNHMQHERSDLLESRE